jgi:1-acyl-sn-glycerol-3-phosphate acyltransferase
MGLYRSHYRCTGVVSTLFTAFVRAYARPRVEGREHIPTNGAFLLVANHASHADTAVLFSILPHDIRQRTVAAAARDYFFRGDLMTTFSRMLYNVVPVDREAQRGPRLNPLRHVERALREGYGVLIYPEGTRSRDGTVGPFRGGIGRLIGQFPAVPVVPVWLEGTTRALPKGTVIPRPVRVTVRIGAPLLLDVAPNNRASEHAAANKVRDAVLALSGRSLSPPSTPTDQPT